MTPKSKNIEHGICSLKSFLVDYLDEDELASQTSWGKYEMDPIFIYAMYQFFHRSRKLQGPCLDADLFYALFNHFAPADYKFGETHNMLTFQWKSQLKIFKKTYGTQTKK